MKGFEMEQSDYQNLRRAIKNETLREIKKSQDELINWHIQQLKSQISQISNMQIEFQKALNILTDRFIELTIRENKK